VSQIERCQLPHSSVLSQEESVELITKVSSTTSRPAAADRSTSCSFANYTHVLVEIHTLLDGGFLVLLNGKSRATKKAQGLCLVVDSHTCVFTKEYDPTRLVTDMAGTLARYLVDAGASLRRCMPYTDIEVMKMYMPVLTRRPASSAHASPRALCWRMAAASLHGAGWPVVRQEVGRVHGEKACGGVDADSASIMRITVDGDLVDASQHPPLGQNFGYMGSDNWNYADIRILETTRTRTSCRRCCVSRF
jgi:biotin carboxyl carrier protein